MKKIIVLMACLMPLTLWAQNQTASSDRDQSVYLELGGASTVVGINYDARFSEFSRWDGVPASLGDIVKALTS
ncbi:hypothetical protein [Prevotella sp. AGR2160]|uniref:hypothetical protein n=1 Tax=Prevotella sp. AGR2160 TaxID=1280674 RepID=UPI001E605134|nr:hypothetical protein [Prevotella sp. AGR2160]